MADTTPGIYGDFVAGLLGAEADRRGILEAKGGSVIATSGTLATLLFGLVAVITGADKYQLPGRAHGWLIAAIVCFAAACFTALLVSMPLPYGETMISDQELLSWWSQPTDVSQLAVASARLQALSRSRKTNSIKAVILMVALGFEVLALVMLTITVARIV